ncbi:ATP-binding protein [Parabacteroides sp. BX2]|uniref:ATP-binding protein n=1 Tax=Parabacteroides segnis TaxID=2763058 RepID=A0ABR7E702_9BACT|nr:MULTISPECIES: ATP-binding protein [Parabacteroides]MBC5645141.1 ATP-binding protein [Parabacteroides segnis]MCM0714886.1 ATP-binding protein [Parabacteroides sp. TA-V-105]
MNAAVRKLPIGIQSFEDIRNQGFLYVDKTALIYKMATTGKPYFLSRPRRFGKSLLLSTIEAYFQGKRELFKGLAIEKLETDWLEYPVLHLDLNARKYESVEALVAILNQHLEIWEALYGDEKKGRSPEERFIYVITRAYEVTGRQVVVLVDEYDKPLLQVFGDEELQTEYLKTLKAFYGVLKSMDRYLKFVFLTGVTKFAHVSVFSDLNQLDDISMRKDYESVCGITKEELVTQFVPELKNIALANELTEEEAVQKMTKQYDGYHFCQNAVGMFNPFSVLNALKYSTFDNYWFQTGTPTFLVELLKKSDYDLRTLINGVETDASSFSEYRVAVNNPIPLIYQSGYLTIKDYDPRFKLYTLCFPNEEVKYGFLNFIAPFYSSISDENKVFYIGKFVRELESGDVDSFLTRLKAFFADFPYELNDKTERHYQVVFYLVFKLMGQFCDAEVRSARGRADAVVKTKESIYIFEFKLNGSAEAALKQINDKGYLIPYMADNRKQIKVGVMFDASERNIGQWLIEE